MSASRHDPASYGDAFADVYDTWYGDLPGRDACVDLLAELAGGGRAIELGIGTGRIAVPLAQRGVRVVGIDASAAMLARLRDKVGAESIDVHVADMARLGDGDLLTTLLSAGEPFAIAYVAINTLFNVPTLEGQQACVAAVARLVKPGGHFVVEAFVPRERGAGTLPADGGAGADAREQHGDHVSVRTIEPHRVVLTVSRTDDDAQVTTGSHVELSDGGGVRLRPWTIRWMTPAQLDALCADRHFVLDQRYAGWSMEPFDTDSTSHVSIYRRENP